MRFCRRCISCGLLGFALALTGCTSLSQWWHNGWKVGPNYVEPPAPAADRWVDSTDPRVKSDAAEDCCWWTVFNDPKLDNLIETAYRENLDLRTAGARILESRAQRNIAIVNLLPQSANADVAVADGRGAARR
jgi:outer membrane protein TolC